MVKKQGMEEAKVYGSYVVRRMILKKYTMELTK